VWISLAILEATLYLFAVVPKGFLPNEDRGQILGSTEAAEGISYQPMFAHQQALAEVIRQDPRVDSLMSSAGGRGGAGASNTGFMLIRLVPKGQRDLDADQMVQVLRAKASQVPGMRVYLQNMPVISIGGRLSKSQYQYTLQGPDTDQLYAAANQLQRHLLALPILQDVTSDLLIRTPR
jgi:HAE1 family hydrophobic/amphiphilic exporter-1